MQIRFIKDKESGESKGYAFVAFKTKEVAEKAVDELHSKEFRVILVALVRLLMQFITFIASFSNVVWFSISKYVIISAG